LIRRDKFLDPTGQKSYGPVCLTAQAQEFEKYQLQRQLKERARMKMSDLPTQHAKPLEIMHESRWLDVLMDKPAAPPASVPPISSGAGWRTSIAIRPEQFHAAEDLVQRRYAWRGYGASGGEPAEATPEKDEAPRVMLLAENSGKLMGTLTVRPDSPRGLLAELTYAVEVRRLRAAGHRLGEVVKLAVEEGAYWKDALDALVQSTYLVARVVHGLSDVIIEVNPRHARFYQRVFGFVEVATGRLCERVGAPSVMLRLDLHWFGRRLQLAA
jgi:hypothetical protein